MFASSGEAVNAVLVMKHEDVLSITSMIAASTIFLFKKYDDEGGNNYIWTTDFLFTRVGKGI